MVWYHVLIAESTRNIQQTIIYFIYWNVSTTDKNNHRYLFWGTKRYDKRYINQIWSTEYGDVSYICRHATIYLKISLENVCQVV